MLLATFHTEDDPEPLLFIGLVPKDLARLTCRKGAKISREDLQASGVFGIRCIVIGADASDAALLAEVQTRFGPATVLDRRRTK